MTNDKVEKIARSTQRSYRSALARVKILAPVMGGTTPDENFDLACNMILKRIKEQSKIFQNVDFSILYKDIL